MKTICIGAMLFTGILPAHAIHPITKTVIMTNEKTAVHHPHETTPSATVNNPVIPPPHEEPATASNKAAVRRLYEEALNKRNMTILPALVSPEYSLGDHQGPAGFEASLAPLIKAFPDMQWHIESIVAEGDQVAVSWYWEGTHAAQYLHYPATGKKVRNTGIGIHTFKDGKLFRSQLMTDRLGFLQSLDVLPATIPAPAAKNGQVSFIDKFLVPPAAIQEFRERTRINRAFIKTLPGFIDDAAYEYNDEKGNLVCVTVAQWESREALAKAKAAVQVLYQQQGFDPAAMFKRLNIMADRGVYTETAE
ncbi:ester cyclase [Chitinophaga lutea]|nr:ester cyclase [Chitinophaga lutea]